MLIITRKLGENIRIGDDIRVVVLDIKGGQVKLGIDAPPHVSVHREEIYDRIREQSRRASKPLVERCADTVTAPFKKPGGSASVAIALGLIGLLGDGYHSTAAQVTPTYETAAYVTMSSLPDYGLLEYSILDAPYQ